MAEQSRLEGARELDRVLAQLPTELAKFKLEQATRAGANVIRRAAIDAAPRDTSGERSEASQRYGPLHTNIKTTKVKSIGGAKSAASVGRGTRGAVEFVVHTSDAFWGLFLEYGTVKHSAQPWFRPAFERAAPEALDRIGDKLGKELEKTASELAGRFGAIRKSTQRRL
jgi:HK97 gp10 family phage protein